ncbi:MAG: hypothetical protein WD555_06265 [Fulvivirga sp.]
MKSSIITSLQVTAMMFIAVLSISQGNAQGVSQVGNNSIFKYMGLEASFGVRNFTLESDIAELQQLKIMEEGGAAAFIFGNNFSRIAAKVGLYYSTAGTKRTIDQLELELNANIYLLKALRIPAEKADIYFLTGFSNQYLKFFGHYIGEDERANNNGGSGREPYLGKISTSNINLGLGIEYRLQAEREFIHFFAEGKTIFEVSSAANIAPFSNTSVEDFYTINVGVRFGRIK